MNKTTRNPLHPNKPPATTAEVNKGKNTPPATKASPPRWSGAVLIDAGYPHRMEPSDPAPCPGEQVPVEKTVSLFRATPPDPVKKRGSQNRPDIPGTKECVSILKHIHPVSEQVFKHSRAVALLAEALGRELNRAGTNLDLDLIKAGAWLHDLAKNQPNHAAVGARLLKDMGFERIADVVANHTDLGRVEDQGLNEIEVVYLADKLLQGDCPVTLNSRFQVCRDRFSGDPEVLRAIESRYKNSVLVKTKIECILGRAVERIMSEYDFAG